MFAVFEARRVEAHLLLRAVPMERVTLESKSTPSNLLVDRASERGLPRRPSKPETKRDARTVEEDERYSNVPCTD
jgi:hypothetical protein